MSKESGEQFIGKRFGMLVIRKDAGRNKHNQIIVIATCDCGKEKEFRLYQLKSKHTTSCGCFKRIWTIENHTTHGKSKHKLYYVWSNMRERCQDKNHKDYQYYGGRGISVCDEWNANFTSFYQFATENGYVDGMQIDRRNNDKNYSPDNCRMVTRKVNMNNTRRLSIKNKTGYRGAWYDKKKNHFCATGRISGNPGLFKRGFATAIEAAVYRDNYYRSLGVDTVYNF